MSMSMRLERPRILGEVTGVANTKLQKWLKQIVAILLIFLASYTAVFFRCKRLLGCIIQ